MRKQRGEIKSSGGIVAFFVHGRLVPYGVLTIARTTNTHIYTYIHIYAYICTYIDPYVDCPIAGPGRK